MVDLEGVFRPLGLGKEKIRPLVLSIIHIKR
jgi:hypothetical protein